MGHVCGFPGREDSLPSYPGRFCRDPGRFIPRCRGLGGRVRGNVVLEESTQVARSATMSRRALSPCPETSFVFLRLFRPSLHANDPGGKLDLAPVAGISEAQMKRSSGYANPGVA